METVDRCEVCGARLYYHERVHHPQTMCHRCAHAAGLLRICDIPGPDAAEVSARVVREVLEEQPGAYPGKE